MPFLKDYVINLVRQFVPSYRFIRAQKSTINSSYMLQTEFDITSIKVLSWNIAKNNYDKNWIRDFLSILEQYQPDIIFLQEVRMQFEAENIIELLDWSWVFAPNFVDAHHQTYAGILTAAKISPITKKAILTQDYEPIIKTPKVSLITEYLISNHQETLLTINSHLINFVDLNKFKTQMHEIEVALSGHRGPMIFAGDFNTWSQKRANILNQTVTKLGLISVSFTPDQSKKIKRFLLSPTLDYIFYRGLSENTTNVKVLDKISSSDHKPLLAEFYNTVT